MFNSFCFLKWVSRGAIDEMSHLGFGLLNIRSSIYPWETLPILQKYMLSWRRHQMETFSTLLALCEGNSPVTARFSSQRPVTRRLYFLCAPEQTVEQTMETLAHVSMTSQKLTCFHLKLYSGWLWMNSMIFAHSKLHGGSKYKWTVLFFNGEYHQRLNSCPWLHVFQFSWQNDSAEPWIVLW